MSVSHSLIRKLLVALAVVVGVVITSVMVLASAWPTINRVETGRTVEYPELGPKIYQLDYDRVYAEALSAVRVQEGWTLLGESLKDGVITAEATMPVTGWRHQVTIKVIKRNAYVSRIHVISESPESPGDLGHNARLIQAYHDALGERLGAADVTDKERIVQE